MSELFGRSFNLRQGVWLTEKNLWQGINCHFENLAMRKAPTYLLLCITGRALLSALRSQEDCSQLSQARRSRRTPWQQDFLPRSSSAWGNDGGGSDLSYCPSCTFWAMQEGTSTISFLCLSFLLPSRCIKRSPNISARFPLLVSWWSLLCGNSTGLCF